MFFTLFFRLISICTGAYAARCQPGFTDALLSEVSGWKITKVGSDADLYFWAWVPAAQLWARLSPRGHLSMASWMEGQCIQNC